MNKKLKTFALVMALVMAFASMAHADCFSRYSKYLLRRGCGDPNGASPELNIYVQHLQTDLNRIGYQCGTVDGIFGSKTKRAVKNFQNHYHEDKFLGTKDYIKAVDGVAGDETKPVLYRKSRKNL